MAVSPTGLDVTLIRPAEDADGEALSGLIAGIFAEYDGVLFVPDEFPELRHPATHYRAKGGAIWVAECDGHIVGSFALMRSGAPGTFELAKVYLAPAFRGGGLAGRLFHTAMAFARSQGATRLELFSDAKFHSGHRFYERNGFRRVPGLRFLGDASDTWEVHMEREL